MEGKAERPQLSHEWNLKIEIEVFILRVEFLAILDMDEFPPQSLDTGLIWKLRVR